MKKRNLKPTQVRVDEETYFILKDISLKTDIPIVKLIRRAVEFYKQKGYKEVKF